VSKGAGAAERSQGEHLSEGPTGKENRRIADRDVQIVHADQTRKLPYVAQELPHIFPGAKLVPWQPVKKTLKGKVADAVAFIVRRLAQAPWSLVTFRAVMDHIGWTDGRDFKRRIRRHQDFVQALADEGIEEGGRGKHPRGFHRVPV
jgi:hypothetical protein